MTETNKSYFFSDNDKPLVKILLIFSTLLGLWIQHLWSSMIIGDRLTVYISIFSIFLLSLIVITTSRKLASQMNNRRINHES